MECSVGVRNLKSVTFCRCTQRQRYTVDNVLSVCVTTRPKVRRGQLGILGRTIPINQQLARALGLKSSTTVQAMRIDANSAGHKGGIRERCVGDAVRCTCSTMPCG